MLKFVLALFLIIALAGTLSAGEVSTCWVARYDGSLEGTDRASALALGDSGFIYVTGYTNGYGIHEDVATIKYKPDGDTAWVRTYDGPAGVYDNGKGIAVDDSGCVYVIADVWAGTSNENFATLKYWPDGSLAWNAIYDGPGSGEDHVAALAIDDSGYVYIFGDSDGGAEDDDFCTIKYRPNGDTAWVRRFGGSNDYEEQAEGIVVDGSGKVYITGTSYRIGTGADIAAVKYDKDGTQEWVRWYAGPGSNPDRPTSITADTSGNIYITGYTGGYETADIVVIKYDSDGNEMWAETFDGSLGADDKSYDIAVDTAGCVYIAGYCDRDEYSHGPDLIAIKYYPNGDTAWARTYNSPLDDVDQAIAIAVDKYCNCYVTGYYGWDQATMFDYVTIKFDPDGNQMWVKDYNGPQNRDDYARDIAVDDSGFVFVTGRSYEDYLTIKYSQRHYDCGDANNDNDVNVSDAVRIINYVFAGGDPPDPMEAGDCNCDSICNVSDAVWIINYVFVGGNEPCDTNGDGEPDC